MSEVLVTVCRGCCCGTEKHPGIDHDGQLKQLTEAGARVRVADCLDVCEHSNVMVVHPGPSWRRRGHRAVWLGGVLDEDATAAVGAWAAAGGPGSAGMPETIRRFVIDRPGQTVAG